MLCLKKHLFQLNSKKEDGDEITVEENQSIVNSKKDEHPIDVGNVDEVIAEEHLSSLSCKEREDDGNVEQLNPDEDRSIANSKKEEQAVDGRIIEEVNAEEDQDQQSASDVIDSVTERELAAVKIQKCFKGHFVRMLAKARWPGEYSENVRSRRCMNSLLHLTFHHVVKESKAKENNGDIPLICSSRIYDRQGDCSCGRLAGRGPWFLYFISAGSGMEICFWISVLVVMWSGMGTGTALVFRLLKKFPSLLVSCTCIFTFTFDN